MYFGKKNSELQYRNYDEYYINSATNEHIYNSGFLYYEDTQIYMYILFLYMKMGLAFPC